MCRLLVAFVAVACAIQCGPSLAEAPGDIRYRSVAHDETTATMSEARSGQRRWAGNRRRFRLRGSYRSHYPSSPFGLGVGVGSGYPGYGYQNGYRGLGYGFVDPRLDPFSYDPYRSGRFKAPNMLDDPYFDAQIRYQNRRRRSPLELRRTQP